MIDHRIVRLIEYYKPKRKGKLKCHTSKDRQCSRTCTANFTEDVAIGLPSRGSKGVPDNIVVALAKGVTCRSSNYVIDTGEIIYTLNYDDVKDMLIIPEGFDVEAEA